MSEKWVGGHSLVFQYIPENQIWISDQVPAEEREKIILHEYTELMAMRDGMPYNTAHIKALQTEGNLSEAELKQREYITPEETKSQFSRIYPKIEEKENTWKLGSKVISFDERAGIIYVHEGEKITDQLLVRSTEDIEKFVEKHRSEI